MGERSGIAIGVALMAVAAIFIVVAIFIVIVSVRYTSCRDDPVCRAEREYLQEQRLGAFEAEYARRKTELEAK